MTRYELLDRIGVGGMAEIFRGKAVAAGGFEKPVAIKRILPHLSQDRRFVELLIAEAKVLSLLKHRNIVQIFDVGIGDDGQYFLVMEYVDGKDIGAIQRALEGKRRRLPFDLCLHVGAEICEALEHAHTSRGPDGRQMSLVHRDVSPSNVLLSRSGEVKLTDFGIAKRAESPATNSGAVRGKFAYISPEQARNESIDPRSDVFSVGILLWELICNRRLFSTLDDLAALRAVREPTVPRPTEVDSRLHPEIDHLLMTALSKDKSRRFASCGQLGQKLRSLRYSLDVTSGDPATELAKIIDSTEQTERESKPVLKITPVRRSGRFDFEGAEATVIRIHTAHEFSSLDDDNSIMQARTVIERFEEEETRQAQLTGDQLRMLRGPHKRDSGEMTAQEPRLAAPRGESPPGDDEETALSNGPLDLLEGFDRAPDAHPPRSAGDSSRPHRRTPRPLPGVRPLAGSSPPTDPQRSRGPTPGHLPRDPQPAPIPRTLHGTPAPQAVQPPPQTLQPPQPTSPQSLGPPAPLPPAPPPTFPASPQGLPNWGAPITAQHPPREATPTTQDPFERPAFPPPPAMPHVAGFQQQGGNLVQPWVLVVGAIIVAVLAFAITRAFIG